MRLKRRSLLFFTPHVLAKVVLNVRAQFWFVLQCSREHFGEVDALAHHPQGGSDCALAFAGLALGDIAQDAGEQASRCLRPIGVAMFRRFNERQRNVSQIGRATWPRPNPVHRIPSVRLLASRREHKTLLPHRQPRWPRLLEQLVLDIQRNQTSAPFLRIQQGERDTLTGARRAVYV